jgi:hypothetical protein
MGRTVYAGGDDFLGFVNLNSLLTVIEDLRKLFNELVNLPLKQFKNKYGETISFSAGICVAHYKEPLSIVLQQARLAQKIAKSKIKDKDSFSKFVEFCRNFLWKTIRQIKPTMNEIFANLIKMKSLSNREVGFKSSRNILTIVKIKFEKDKLTGQGSPTN